MKLHQRNKTNVDAQVDEDYASIMERPWFRYFRNLREGVLKRYLSQHPEIPLDRVLDLGCANSVHLGLFPSGSLKIGIDPSMEALRTSDDATGSHFAAGDAGRIPLKDSSINFLLASGLMHHVHEFMEDVLNEMYRVLAPGGILYIDEPNGLNPLWKLVLLSPIGREVDHGLTKTVTAKQIMKAAPGFECKATIYYGLTRMSFLAVRLLVVLRKPMRPTT